MSIFRLFEHTTAAIFEVHWTIIKVCLSEVIIFRFHKWYTPRILLQFRTWWQTSRHWWKARTLQRNCGICCIKGVHGWLHFFSCQLKYWTLNCCFVWFYDSICLGSLTVTIWVGMVMIFICYMWNTTLGIEFIASYDEITSSWLSWAATKTF